MVKLKTEGCVRLPSIEDRRVPDQDRDFGRLLAYRDSSDVIYWVRRG